jgi:type IV pilus assembly protein PilW
MIALALGTVIILGVTTLFSDSSRAINDINRVGRQLENSLYAMDLLAKEIALVDYWGEAAAPVSAIDEDFGPLRPAEMVNLEVEPYPSAPPLCVGTGATGVDPRIELGFAMEYPLLSGLGADLNAALTTNQCKGDGSAASAAGAYVAIRRASTCATGSTEQATANSCRPLDDFYYLQTNGCYNENAGLKGGEVRLRRATSGDYADVLDALAFCDPDQPLNTDVVAPIYRFESRIYYVNQDDQLVRLSLDKIGDVALGYQQEILVDGVEHLQFEWFIDTTRDGQYNKVRDTRFLEYEDAANIIGAKIWLVVRNPRERPGYTDQATYMVAGEEWTVPDGKAGYPRTLQSRMVELPNRVARRP